MEKVFFIIPIYNVEAYIRRCIDSVLAQNYQNVQIILVDDGSPDNCPAICDEYERKNKNIKVIHKKNGGLSDARNAGLMYIKAKSKPDDFIVFLDSDDFIHEHFAKNMLDLCKKYSCDMAQCGYEKGNDNSFSQRSSSGNNFYSSSQNALLQYSLKSQCWAKIYKVKLFKDLYYPVGMINEDEFVTYRAVYRAKNVAFTSEQLYYYFQHGTSIMENIAKKLKDSPNKYDFLKAYKERIDFFELENEPDQVKKTQEKICTDIILRYCEQMHLSRDSRDIDCINGTYIRIYRKNFRKMITRKGIPLKRKLMYICFYVVPYSGVLVSNIFTLRK